MKLTLKDKYDNFLSRHPLLDDIDTMIVRYFNIIDWYREVKWFFQELFKGYSDCDLWGLDYFIVRKLKKPLKAFVEYNKKHRHGCPPEFFNTKYKNECQKWHDILDEILWSFEHYDMEIEENPYSIDKDKKQYLEFLYSHRDKQQKGLELFGKYLNNFWD